MRTRTRGGDNHSPPPKVLGTPGEIAAQIRRALKDGGSPKDAAGVQWFFKDAINAHGWHTADLRRAVVGFRRELRKGRDLDFLLEVADHLFSGSALKEKICAVFLLEKLEGEFGGTEFELFESWLDRIGNWADHDALVHCLISPMVAARPARTKTVSRWAKSPNRWRRRAACVALIRGARAKMFFLEITRLSNSASYRQRRHGAEGIRLAPARDRQTRRQAHGPLSDENSRAGSAIGAAHGVRNVAFGHSKTDSRRLVGNIPIRPNPRHCLQ